jgi:hypothetical protein
MLPKGHPIKFTPFLFSYIYQLPEAQALEKGKNLTTYCCTRQQPDSQV